jgi:L-ascorbate metabolism protein UlaG (beta-lactamase superfamily)
MAEFRWFGHNCFRIRAKEATLLTDPVARSTGYVMPRQAVDIVTISHDHPGHSNLAAVRPDYEVIRGPGEYELQGVFVTGIRTYHDAESGRLRGYNTIYVIEIEGMKVAHLGDLGHRLTETQQEALTNVDVLMIPAGGGDVISQENAALLVAELSAKAVLPMQFATAIGDKGLGGVDAFCKQLGVDVPEARDKLTLRPSDLSETMQLFVLAPESEAAKRS